MRAGEGEIWKYNTELKREGKYIFIKSRLLPAKQEDVDLPELWLHVPA